MIFIWFVFCNVTTNQYTFNNYKLWLKICFQYQQIHISLMELMNSNNLA